VVLPGQTGKTDGYRVFAIVENRFSSKSLIGYATTDGPRPGSLHQRDLPIVFDEIQELETYDLLRYLPDLMETGHARIDLAGFPFDIWCLSILSILANPIGTSAKMSFGLILQHLCNNPVIGRRFGIILYDQDRYDERGRPTYLVPRIKVRESNLAENEEVKKSVEIFRAVEEYCRPKIKKIVEEAWDWLNTRNEEWVKRSLEAIRRLRTDSSTEKVYEFLANFIQYGYSHTRGGALYAAIVDNLDKIALGEVESFEGLKPLAEDYLNHLLDINYHSVIKIAETYEAFRELDLFTIFDTLPSYMKEIVSAVELYRRELWRQGITYPVPVEISLKQLNDFYRPSSRPYFSAILYDARRSNPTRYNKKLKDHFGFEIRKTESDELKVVIYRREPIDGFEPLGSVTESFKSENSSSFQNFQNFRTGLRDRDIGDADRPSLSDRFENSESSESSEQATEDVYEDFGLRTPRWPTLEEIEEEVKRDVEEWFRTEVLGKRKRGERG